MMPLRVGRLRDAEEAHDSALVAAGSERLAGEEGSSEDR